MKKVYQLKVTLTGVSPSVWRRVLVPGNVTMRELHEILNHTMGWMSSHLHCFEVNGQGIGDLEWDELGEWQSDLQVKLRDVAKAADRFTYDYDFGDGWRHDVLIEKALDADPKGHYPVCIAGKNACPPEDCGGTGGFKDFKDVMSDPKHPEHKEIKAWHGRKFNPKKFDLDDINKNYLIRRRVRSAAKTASKRLLETC